MSPKRDMATLRTQYRDVWCGRTHHHTPMKARLRSLSGRQHLFPPYLFSSLPAPLPHPRTGSIYSPQARKERREICRVGCWRALPLYAEGVQFP